MLAQPRRWDFLETLWHIVEVIFSVFREFQSECHFLPPELPTRVNNLLSLSKLRVYHFRPHSKY